MFAHLYLVAALGALQAAAAAFGKHTQRPACVQKCWDYTQYVSLCNGDQQCLCADSEFQNAVYQCLYSQCQTAFFANALHHTLAICQAPQGEHFDQPQHHEAPAILRQDHQRIKRQGVQNLMSNSASGNAGPSVTRSAGGQSVSRSAGSQSVTRSAGASVTRSAGEQSVTRSAGASVTRSAGMQSVTRSAGMQSVTRSAMQSVNRSAMQSAGSPRGSPTRAQGSPTMSGRLSQISDHQVQAPTQAPPASQISDHQVQAPTIAAASQASDHQPQVPTSAARRHRLL